MGRIVLGSDEILHCPPGFPRLRSGLPGASALKILNRGWRPRVELPGRLSFNRQEIDRVLRWMDSTDLLSTEEGFRCGSNLSRFYWQSVDISRFPSICGDIS